MQVRECWQGDFDAIMEDFSASRRIFAEGDFDARMEDFSASRRMLAEGGERI